VPWDLLKMTVWDTGTVNARSASATFVGRERELDQLVSMLGELDATGARTALIAGEAGIGKTRLIDELRQRARAAGALVGTGVCTPAEGGGLPYGPVVGVLRDLARQLDELTAAAVLGGARRGLGLGAPASAELDAPPPAELAKTHLFESLLEACTGLAERSRIVVVFEDLHWADSASMEVVEFLVRNLSDEPVLLVGTYRTDEDLREHAFGRLIVELARHRSVTQLELGGFDRDTTGALMREMLGGPRIGLCSTRYTPGAAGTRSSSRN
jgi:predicted ATPase